MALHDFKKQLDSLSESLHHFDPEERNKALGFLQECIQGLENKNSCSLIEGLNEGMLSTSVEEIIEEKRNNVAIPALNEDVCQKKSLPAVKTDGYYNQKIFEEEKVICNSNHDKEEVYSPTLNSCQSLNILDEKKVEGPDKRIKDYRQNEEESRLQTDEECQSVLKCPKCEEVYDSKSSFFKHLQHYSGKLKTCTDCHKEFKNSLSFKFHKQLKFCLKLNKMFKCKLCNKTLYGGSQYNSHLNAHKRNQCQTCGDHFASRKHLEAHTVRVHDVSINKDLFRCHLCDRTFAQRRSLVYHYKISHPENSLICSVCLEMFDSECQLEAHQTNHKQQSFTCEKCNEQFSRRQQYLVHIQGHERYKCTTCSESFSAKRVAIKHAQTGHQVTGLKPQLQCAQCGQMFCTRALFNSHMIQHRGENTLACEKCKVIFKHERYYRRHLETDEHLHGEGPKNLLACSECNKTFTNKTNLRVHISRMHKANMKEHSCTHCSYKTTIHANLKRHIALHTKKPQFICDKCGIQLQTKNALQEHHMQLHAESKDCSCYKCGRMFGRSSDLNRHLLNTHSDIPLYSCHCGNNYKTLSNLQRHQLLTHGEVKFQKKRLKKLFVVEHCDPPKKKRKRQKTICELSPPNVDDLHLLNSQILPSVVETNTVVMMTDKHPHELLEVSYNMNFNGEDKSQIVYTQNLDMNGLHVVESMVELDNDPTKQETSVLINVRNIYGCPLPNEFIIPSPMDSPSVSSLEPNAVDRVNVTSQKQQVITSTELQDYVIPSDLNFLNV